MKLDKEEKESYLNRLKIEICFIEMFLCFENDKLHITEINCLNDVINLLKDLKSIIER